ncbi:MAG: sigma-70 family RNA polymerase sigma factor [Acidobacteria bacterium]|nr:sigma-70 family RNA polymerase sigma factor [Acidobacteriota bacterium]
MADASVRVGEPASLVDAESSLRLLERARVGDREALDALMARYLPRLRRWASGRLPRWARDLADTQDLVQDVMLQTFKRIDGFEARHEGALQAYLRQGIANRIRDEFRRAGRRPATTELDTRTPELGASPLEEAIGQEALERYERALARLRPEDREAIVARIELDCTNEEIAVALGKPSANAARMAVERALVRLADEMRRACNPRRSVAGDAHVVPVSPKPLSLQPCRNAKT